MSNENKFAAPKKKYVLAKGQGLQIPGVGLLITNDNVNDPNIITIVQNVQKRTGRTYFGTAIVEK